MLENLIFEPLYHMQLQIMEIMKSVSTISQNNQVSNVLKRYFVQIVLER